MLFWAKRYRLHAKARSRRMKCFSMFPRCLSCDNFDPRSQWSRWCKLVKEWVEQHSDQIQLFFMPSYSPELNPDEYLNCDLKSGVYSTAPARSKSQLKSKALSHIRMPQKKPDRAAKLFKHSKVAYAA